MQFTLQTLLLSFVVVASALAAFDGWGLVVAAVILAIVAYIRGSQSPWRAARNVLIGLVLGCCLLGFLLPDVSVLRDTGRLGVCHNNMKHIALALEMYHEKHGHFPPAYVLGPDGKPWHSWRTLILPYLERRDIYDLYRFDEPWDGPNNSKLASIALRLFICPADATPGFTNYVAIVGPEAAWPGAMPASLDDIKDNRASTILLVEVEGGNIAWSEPRDISFAEACRGVDWQQRNAIAASHPRDDYFHLREPVTVVALADGRTRSFSATTAPDTWRAWLTRAGGEDEDADAIWNNATERLHWGHIGGLICLVLSTLVLLLRPIRRNAAPAIADSRASGG